MNVNYIGSLAERRLKFSSVVSVESIDSSDLFNSVSIYMPSSFAAANIVDFDPSVVTKDSPALLAVTVDNYKDELKGDLLAQVSPIFRDDTNFEATVYVIVFLDKDDVTTMWEFGEKYIAFEPLTSAFQALYFLSYFKILFDPTYDGEQVTIPGVAAKLRLSLTNGGVDVATIAAGTYSAVIGDKTFHFALGSSHTLGAGDALMNVEAVATVVGTTTNTTATPVLYSDFTPALDTDIDIAITAVVQGAAAVTRASNYFDLALAMAYQAKANLKLSAFIAIAKLAWSKIDTVLGTDTNKCQVRAKTLAEELAAMTSIETCDRAAFFYGALRLMEAQNTSLLVDCESRNVFSLLLNTWFASKNSSGNYVGNKLHLLRISGARCFGPVSPINALYNAGDPDGYDNFDEKNVGCLVPISASSTGDSALSMFRGVTGVPINALMIAKFVDYKSSQNCADMITDKGTLTNPVLTNEEAYQKIQNIVINNLVAFTGTKRITGIVSQFPTFNEAKVGKTALAAASSWKATYVDDLDTVTISGGITAE